MKKNSRDALSKGPSDCRGCVIREFDIFADLLESDFNLIDRPIEAMRFATDSTLYCTNDPGRWLFTIRKGLVKLTQYLPEGVHRIVRLLRPGAVAGMEALLGNSYEHTAKTIQPTMVCRIPVEVVLRLETDTPRLHHQLMERWHTLLHDADEWLIELSTGHARARMARLLLFLLDTADDECELLNREDMGAILGLTTETASRTVAEFKRAGAIQEIGPHLCACNVGMLRNISRE